MTTKETPYIAISNQELDAMPEVGNSEYATCPNCKEQHLIEYGTTNGKPSKMIGFVNCNGKTYMATLMGRMTA